MNKEASDPRPEKQGFCLQQQTQAAMMQTQITNDSQGPRLEMSSLSCQQPQSRAAMSHTETNQQPKCPATTSLTKTPKEKDRGLFLVFMKI